MKTNFAFRTGLLLLVVGLVAVSRPSAAQGPRQIAMHPDNPPHKHLKYYGYHLLGDVGDYREDIRELAKYTNFISFTTHELWMEPREGLSRGLVGLSPEERKQAFASAAEKIRFAKSLGLDMVIANVGGPLMMREDTREPWFAWLHELRDEMSEEMKMIHAFYIYDEPDIRDVTREQLSQWIDEFKSVFPDVKVVATYAIVGWSEDMTPPDNLDYIAIDPYINFPVDNPAEGFIAQYDERFHQALEWVRKWDRPAFMVGDAYAARGANEAKNPMPGAQDTLWFFYLSLAEENIEGLIWWYYGGHKAKPMTDIQGFRLNAFPETEETHREIGNALLGIGKEPAKEGQTEQEAPASETVSE